MTIEDIAEDYARRLNEAVDGDYPEDVMFQRLRSLNILQQKADLSEDGDGVEFYYSLMLLPAMGLMDTWNAIHGGCCGEITRDRESGRFKVADNDD